MLKKEGFNYKEHPARERQEPVGAFCTWRTSGQESDTEKAWRIINQSGFVVFLWQNKAAWPVQYVSENVEALTGYSDRDFMKGYVSYASLIHPDDLPRVRSEVETAGADPSISEFTHAPYRIHTKEGAVKWVADRTRIHRNEAGEITHFEGVVHDITDSRRKEELLRVRLSLFEFAQTHSADDLLQKTLDEVEALTDSTIGFFHLVEPDQQTFSLQAWSSRTDREFCRIEGKGLHNRLDQAGVWTDCIHAGGPVIHNDYASLPHRKGLPEGHVPLTRELVAPILRDGIIVAILGIGNKPLPYTEKDLETVAFLGDVSWNIVAQRQMAEKIEAAEKALRQEQGLLSRILDATAEGVIYIDPAYRVVRANQVAADMCGLTPDAVEGKKCYEVFQNERCHTDACFLRCAGHEAPASEGEVRLSCRVDRAKEIPAFVAGRAVKDPAGKFAGVVESLRDLTEWKRAEQKTRQALQVKALAEGYAQMSGLLLHRMGNLLTPMQIEIERMQARGTEHALDYLEKAHEDLMRHLTDLSHYLQHDERGKEVFSFMEKAIRSLQKGEQDLSGQLREMASAVSRISEILSLQGQYAGKGYERKEPLDLNAMIEDVLRMQSSMIEAKGLWVRKELAGGLPAVVMEPRHMQFLINSLIRNGWDSDRERDAGSEERWISVLTSKRNGTVRLEVQYVGCGSDWAETKALVQDGRISAGASDISLYFCKQLIEADNGTLSVERNGKGQGTSVQVLFGENA